MIPLFCPSNRSFSLGWTSVIYVKNDILDLSASAQASRGPEAGLLLSPAQDVCFRQRAPTRAHEVLEYVGLRDQRYRKIGTFSTGMAQSAKLGCAIVHDPELLIVDEPSNGLDQEHRGFMLDTLFQIVRDGGRSILMSSHLMDDVQAVCDQVVMIHKGRVVVHRKIEDLAKQIDREIEITVWGGGK